MNTFTVIMKLSKSAADACTSENKIRKNRIQLIRRATLLIKTKMIIQIGKELAYLEFILILQKIISEVAIRLPV